MSHCSAGGIATPSVLQFLLQLFFNYVIFPIYALLGLFRPRHDDKSKKGILVKEEEGMMTYRSTNSKSELHHKLNQNDLDTVPKVLAYAAKMHSSKPCLGTRKRILESSPGQSQNPTVTVGGAYEWTSYFQVNALVKEFSKGLKEIGAKSGDKICFLADTREEWMITAFAALHRQMIIVTLYTTMGEEAMIRVASETEAKYFLSMPHLLPKLKSLIDKCPSVQHVISIEDASATVSEQDSTWGTVTLHKFQDVLEKGKQAGTEEDEPKSGEKDVAMIMYTSGSTGVPKGVMLSHRNIIEAMKSYCDVLDPLYPTDVYLAYLPLAHVLEFMCECVCILHGMRIGYSSPTTLTDNSPNIKPGANGDASLLQPTIMASVPLILTRIQKGIMNKIRGKGPLAQYLFKIIYHYKLYWTKMGYNTPLVDALFFRTFKNILGGKLRAISTGGAPLPELNQEFIRNCFCVPVLSGYGLTETASCATFTTFADWSTGRVGGPLGLNEIRLIDWKEGGYTTNDKPYPRGEIVIGGANVALGYFKLEEETKQSFFEENGKRFFRSGDIAEVHEDGVFKIIDRKKDLVKLKHGEYISPSLIEAVLKTHSLVDNICITADSQGLCIALIVPNKDKVKALSEMLKKPSEATYEETCAEVDVQRAVLGMLRTHGKNSKLSKFEIPARVYLCHEEWTPASGLVTDTLKLRRRKIHQKYKEAIDVERHHNKEFWEKVNLVEDNFELI